MTTAGERIIKSAKQALAFAEGKKDHGCTVHIPDEIDVTVEGYARSQEHTGTP